MTQRSIVWDEQDDWLEIEKTVHEPSVLPVPGEFKFQLLRFDVFRQGQGRQSPPFIRLYKTANYKPPRSGYALPEPWNGLFKRPIRHSACPMYGLLCNDLAAFGHRYFLEEKESEIWQTWTCERCPQYSGQARFFDFLRFSGEDRIKLANLISAIGRLSVYPVREEALAVRFSLKKARIKRYQMLFDGEIREFPDGANKKTAVKVAGDLMSETGRLVDLYFVKHEGQASPVADFPYAYYASIRHRRTYSPLEYYQLRRGQTVEFLGLITRQEAAYRYEKAGRPDSELWVVKPKGALVISDPETLVPAKAKPLAQKNRSGQTGKSRETKNDWRFAIRFNDDDTRLLRINERFLSMAIERAKRIASACKERIVLLEKRAGSPEVVCHDIT